MYCSREGMLQSRVVNTSVKGCEYISPGRNVSAKTGNSSVKDREYICHDSYPLRQGMFQPWARNESGMRGTVSA